MVWRRGGVVQCKGVVPCDGRRGHGTPRDGVNSANEGAVEPPRVGARLTCRAPYAN